MTPEHINILQVSPAGEHRLQLIFDDGTERTLDFYPFLSRARHQDIRAYLDLERFADHRLEYGELVWGDYDLCFPIIDLYRGTLLHHAEYDSAA